MADIIKPSIHLNGTGRAELERQIETAVRAIHEAERALSDASPNARDYYVQGPDAFGVASAQHANRAMRIRSVYDELMAIYDSIVG